MGLRQTLIASAIGLMTIAGTHSASAAVVDFELPALSSGAYEALPASFQGFNWSWAGRMNTAGVTGTGFEFAANGGTHVGFASDINIGGNPVTFSSASTFSLDSLWLTSIANPELTVTVKGYSGGTSGNLEYTLNLSLWDPVGSNDNVKRFFDLASFGKGGVAVDTVTMTSSGIGGSGNLFAFDDITYTMSTPVPEPDSYAMLLAGLGALGFMSRRRRAG